jgi:hypothetical protein
MVMSRDQNEGQKHNINIVNESFEKVERYKYFGKTLTNQNSIQEKINRRLKSGNAYHHSVQIFFPSNLLYKNIKIEVHETIILPVV